MLCTPFHQLLQTRVYAAQCGAPPRGLTTRFVPPVLLLLTAWPLQLSGSQQLLYGFTNTSRTKDTSSLLTSVLRSRVQRVCP
jgi:hypothetical protein